MHIIPEQSGPNAARNENTLKRLSALLRELPNRLRRPVAGGTYSAEIDGLRFIAIAIVVVGHFMERAVRFFPTANSEIGSNPLAEFLLRPGIGVYLFFAISGFIITRQVMKARTQPLSSKFLKAYFGRRILRIEPPYIVLLVATWLLLVVAGYKPDQTTHFDVMPTSLGTSLVGSVFYLHDVVWGTYPRLFPPGWSLEVEVQFYLMAPVLFWAFFKTRSVPGRLAIGALGMFGGALLSLTAPQDIGPVHTNVSIFRFFHFFWLGIVLAHSHGWIVRKAERISPKLIGALGWLGLACYFVMPIAPENDLVVAMAIRAATLASLTAVFVAAFVNGSSFRAFCERPWISVIGGACYSIYLTHLQAIQAMTSLFAKVTPHAGVGLLAFYFVIEMIIVVVIGMIFYSVIERTFMMKDWPARFQTHVKTFLETLSHGVNARRSQPIGPQTVAERLESSGEPR